MAQHLRTGQEVYHQIRWDPRLDPEDIVIGYHTRDEGVEETPYVLFVADGEVPWHRIRYFRRGEERLWDRDERINRLVATADRNGSARSEALDAAPVHHAALVVIPPADAWAPLQAIRQRHDRHFDRWMPHLDILYGFVPEKHFEAASGALEELLAREAPFRLTLARFDHFVHRSSATIWLEPETTPAGACERLEARLRALFPRCREQAGHAHGGYRPHLSVGQVPGTDPSRITHQIESFARDWRPLHLRIDQVSLIARRGEAPFAVRHEVSLGT